MKQNFSISFSARLHRAVQLCALLGILLSFSSNAWGECYLVDETTTHTESTKTAGTVLYSYTCNSGEYIRSVSANVSGYYTKVAIEYYGPDIDLQYNNGGIWTTVAFYSPKTSKNKNGSISFNFTSNSIANVSEIRFVTTTDHGGRSSTGNTDYSVSNIKITRATTFSPESASLALGKTSAGLQKSNTMTVNYSNLDGQTVSANITGNNASLFSASLSKTTLDCNGDFIATVTFNPALDTPAGTYSATVNLSCGGQNSSFNVSAIVTEAVITSIAWNQSFTSLLSINNPADITLDATVVDPQGNPIADAAVTYSSADNNVVSIINGNVLHIVGDGRTTITATYTSDDEEVRTSSVANKTVFVSDGSQCNTLLVDEQEKIALNYGETKSYSWAAPAMSTFSFDLWKQTGGTQNAIVTCKDANDNTLATYTYETSLTQNKDIPTSATKKTENLPAGTKKLEFKSEGTLDKYFQNITVEQATYLEKITNSLGNVSGDNSANASINFKYSNVPTAISASLKGESEIAVSATPVGNGCGDWKDNATINLVFTPKSTGKRQYTYSGNVVLSAGANEGLKTIEIPVNITIDMPFGTLNNGLAMLYKDEEIVLDTHTSAYWAEWNGDNTTLSIRSIGSQNVAAEMPVLLVGDGVNNFYTFTVEENPTLTPKANNAFYYTTTDETAVDPVVFFVLGVKDGVAAFYKFTGEVPAGKVVLKMTKTDPMAAVPTRIDIELNEQTATALRPVYADEQADMNGQIFTIMGLPVSSMDQPGIYIMNGKKYIVR